jgi:hypothetical protein
MICFLEFATTFPNARIPDLLPRRHVEHDVMQKKDHFDFWYAVNNTEIIMMPQRHLETFGTTTLNYHLVSEMMDAPDQIRVREGRMQAAQPEIITPEAYAETFLEGFGEEASRYIEWLRQHEEDVDLRILKYGYRLRQESYSEQTVTGDAKTIAERVHEQVKGKDDALSAVVIGVDDPWDVCLVKLFWEVIRSSARTNITEMQNRHLFDSTEEQRKRLHVEIEGDFLAASKNPALVPPLGQKLQRLHLFNDYEDRFFSLVKASKRK